MSTRKYKPEQIVTLLRQSVYSRLAGYEDVNDAERPCHDPTFRLTSTAAAQNGQNEPHYHTEGASATCG